MCLKQYSKYFLNEYRNIFGSKAQLACNADNPIAIYKPIV
jgi:hypothetical protein